MLEFAFFGSVLILAGVGLRQRSSTKTQNATDGSSSTQPTRSPQRKQHYTSSLLIPILVGVVLFGIYYSVPTSRFRDLLGIRACRPPTPEQRAASWDYHHNHHDLSNVSDSSTAQTLFNQGLLWRWGYSLESAQATFEAAVTVDPTCAMCHWGLAYASSPFANIVALRDEIGYPHYTTQMNRDARGFLEKAQKLPKRSQREAKYIEAMWIRLPEVNEVERKHQEWVEFLYGAKLMTIWKEEKMELAAGVMAAEAFVNCMPWDYYAPHSENRQPFGPAITWGSLIDLIFPDQEKSQFTKTTGISVDERVLESFPLKSETEEKKVRDHRMRPLARVVEHLLLRILEENSEHAMATHLHIHLTEASMANEPRKGLASANKLAATSSQWKAGHLIHMPSHNYYRVGEYLKAVEVNEAAQLADIESSQNCMDPYVPEHNVKVLIAAASMGGFLDKAEEHALTLRTISNRIAFRAYLPSGFDYVAALDVWGQFGQWEKLLQAEPPSEGARGMTSDEGFVFATAIYHFYQYMAQTHRSRSGGSRRLLMDERASLKTFQEAAAQVSKKPDTYPGVGVGIYSAAYYGKIQIAIQHANARNATLQGDTEGAMRFMEKLGEVVDEMGYMEPPWAQQAPKQCLGYLLLHNKQYDAAKEMYNRDLGENPRNPWSTLGLAQVYAAQNLKQDAERMTVKYQKSGSAQLGSSCPMLQMD